MIFDCHQVHDGVAVSSLRHLSVAVGSGKLGMSWSGP